MIKSEWIPVYFNEKQVGKVHQDILHCDTCGKFKGLEKPDNRSPEFQVFEGWYTLTKNWHFNGGVSIDVKHFCGARCLLKFANKESK